MKLITVNRKTTIEKTMEIYSVGTKIPPPFPPMRYNLLMDIAYMWNLKKWYK